MSVTPLIWARIWRQALLACCLVLFTQAAVADTAKEVFEQAKASVLQVLNIEIESDKKASFGSGFALSDDWGQSGLIATNFHVVSTFVHDPEQYTLRFIDDAGVEGALELVAFDVVHDLALVRRTDDHVYPGLSKGREDLAKGETVYSLGNPFDLGQTIVPGTFNGLLTTSFYEKLLFSGSLNPGMSGGPAVGLEGAVVGINVATSGNQISFLVPVGHLQRLVDSASSSLAVEKYQEEIGRQLVADQDYKYELLLGLDWQTQELGASRVGADLSDYFKCWGDTRDDEDLRYQTTDTNCSSQDYIFVSSGFSTGVIDYQYTWTETDELNSLQFDNLLTDSSGSMYTRNSAQEEDVTSYQCENVFSENAERASGLWRNVFCVRRYRAYPELYDVLYLGVLIDGATQGLTSHFALSGVSLKNARAFAAKFMELQSWAS